MRTKRVFLFSKSYIQRDNTQYLIDVENCKSSQPSRGVKGPCYLSKLINIPEQVLFDYMHVSIRGPMEQLLNLWFNSKNSHKQWYIGNKSLYLKLITLQYELNRNLLRLTQFNESNKLPFVKN